MPPRHSRTHIPRGLRSRTPVMSLGGKGGQGRCSPGHDDTHVGEGVCVPDRIRGHSTRLPQNGHYAIRKATGCPGKGVRRLHRERLPPARRTAFKAGGAPARRPDLRGEPRAAARPRRAATGACTSGSPGSPGRPGCPGTALSGSISTVLTGLSWICVGIHSRRALPTPVCA